MCKLDKERKIYYGMVGLIVILLWIFGLGRAIGPFFPPDEFGYWANAAKMVGYDWSGVVSGQSEYSMGYSLLLAPLMLVFKDPIILYRSAIILNGLLFIYYAALIDRLMRMLFPRLSLKKLYLICIVGLCYSSLIVYMHYTMAEMLLYVLFLAFSVLFLRFMRDRQVKDLVWCAVFGILLLMTHMRTIGVVVAFGIALTAYLLKDRLSRGGKVRFWGILSVGAVVLLAIILYAIKPQSVEGVQEANGLMNQLAKVHSLWEWNNLCAFAIGLLGKLFYVGAASFGLGYLGMIRAIKEYKKRESTAAECYFCRYILLVVISTLLISTLYFINGYRIDQLIYGRYSELYMPLLICFGIVYLLENEHVYRSMAVVFLIQFAGASILNQYIDVKGMDIYMRDFIIGASWLFGRKQPHMEWVFLMPVILGLFVSMFMAFVIRVVKKGNRDILLSTFAVIFLEIGIYMTSVCVYDCHEADRSDLDLVYRVEELQQEGKHLYFLNSPYSPYIGFVQFHMPDQTIQVTEGLCPEAFETPEEDMVLTYPDYELPEQLSRYGIVEGSCHFRLYYNGE